MTPRELCTMALRFMGLYLFVKGISDGLSLIQIIGWFIQQPGTGLAPIVPFAVSTGSLVVFGLLIVACASRMSGKVFPHDTLNSVVVTMTMFDASRIAVAIIGIGILSRAIPVLLGTFVATVPPQDNNYWAGALAGPLYLLFGAIFILGNRNVARLLAFCRASTVTGSTPQFGDAPSQFASDVASCPSEPRS